MKEEGSDWEAVRRAFAINDKTQFAVQDVSDVTGSDKAAMDRLSLIGNRHYSTDTPSVYPAWEPLERVLMISKYRHGLGLPFGPLTENQNTDLEDVLISHIVYMKRVVYGDMSGPFAAQLMASLLADVAALGSLVEGE